MNERIKELAEIADQLTEDELVHLERVHNRLYSFTESKEIYNQKFTELIVRECMDIAYEYDGAKLSGPGMIIANRVRQHFGVEQ